MLHRSLKVALKNTLKEDKMPSFEGKTAIVTGGVSGIGFATVKRFLDYGMQNVVILDLNDSRNVTQTLQSSYKSQNVVFIRTDVSKKDQVKSAFAEVVSQFKFIDIVIGCAGVLKERDYELTLNVNVVGLFHTHYTAVDLMSIENGGRGGIVAHVASMAGLNGLFSMAAYSATKSAVVGLNNCFGTEFFFNKHGIKFVTICPGFTDTPLLNDFENALVPGTYEATMNIKLAVPSQTSDNVGQCISEVLNSAKNGSVFIIEGGEAREITLHSYFKL